VHIYNPSMGESQGRRIMVLRLAVVTDWVQSHFLAYKVRLCFHKKKTLKLWNWNLPIQLRRHFLKNNYKWCQWFSCHYHILVPHWCLVLSRGKKWIFKDQISFHLKTQPK
jgi:hypothetical protein